MPLVRQPSIQIEASDSCAATIVPEVPQDTAQEKLKRFNFLKVFTVSQPSKLRHSGENGCGNLTTSYGYMETRRNCAGSVENSCNDSTFSKSLRYRNNQGCGRQRYRERWFPLSLRHAGENGFGNSCSNLEIQA